MTSQEVPKEIKASILDYKAQLYSKGSIVREIKKLTKDKELAVQYVELVLGERKKELENNPQLYKDEGKRLMKVSAIGLVISIPLVFFTRLALIFSVVAFVSLIIGLVKYLGGFK